MLITEDANSATPTQDPNQQRIETLFRRLTWNSQKTVLRSIMEIGQLDPSLLNYALAVACIRGKNLPLRLELIEVLVRIGPQARGSTAIVLVELMRVEQPAIIRVAA